MPPIIILPAPPPTTIWTYSTDIEKELDYVIAQLKVSEVIHGMVQDSIDKLRDLGYPQHNIDFIKEQFKKPIRKRELPSRSTQIEDYMQLVRKEVTKAFVNYIKLSPEEAEKTADKIIAGVKNQHPIENLPAIKAAIESTTRQVVATTLAAQKQYGVDKFKVVLRPEMKKREEIPAPPEKEIPPPPPIEKEVVSKPEPIKAPIEPIIPVPKPLKKPPELDLMKREIEERIARMKAEKARGELKAGEGKELPKEERLKLAKQIAATYPEMEKVDTEIKLDKIETIPREKRIELAKKIWVREGTDILTEPRDYSQWTFGDFEGLLPGLEDIEDLWELYEQVGASEVISEADMETLRNIIKARIEEVKRHYIEWER